MPRIDPIQLLKCLSVLLSPNGGVKSRDEVKRLANLMTKFSKKLVSKCIYIQILKCTETDLLGLFMGSGGWRLVHTWLTESIVANNWPLVRELLELLLLCPVDIERLKTNNCPKLVKELSKDGNHFAIRALASKLVEQWLKTVKGEQVSPIFINDIQQIITSTTVDPLAEMKQEISVDMHDKIVNDKDSKPYNNENSVFNESELLQSSTKKAISEDSSDKEECMIIDNKIEDSESEETEVLPVLKITLKDGKQIISQIEDSEKQKEKTSSYEKDKSSKHRNSNSKEKYSSSNSSSKHTSKSHSSSSSDKHRSSSHGNSSPSKQKERSRDKSKHSSSSRSKSNDSSSSRRSSDKNSSSRSKDYKEKNGISKDKHSKHKDSKNEKNNKECDKNESEKSLASSIHKLGKIPKLSDAKKDKPSISIEIRKPEDPKPKTVKTFHSKFRKHGLEEEMKPPPSRAALLSKKSSVVPPTVTIPKRSSPVHSDTPPEKKIKIVDPVDKPGAIKLIPAKPKPMLLLESDMFMDALNASATNKKEPKKRKRRISGSKDGNTSGDASPPTTPTSSISSPNSDNKSVPLRFYQDTLDAEEEKDKVNEKTENDADRSDVKSPINNDDDDKNEISERTTLTINGLKGVLCYNKKKGPKKSIKWKPDLEEIQYFELDETERVNVTKTFTDMKHLERIQEKEGFQKARNLINDDVMEEKTNWAILIPVDCDGQINVEYGKNSKEKEIQAIRQKGTLQPLYFHKAMIPDSPHEPEIETHTYNEPSTIPLEDITGNQDNISDFRNMPWPEPKGNAPPTVATNINIPPMFQPPLSQFPNNFQNSQFVVPGFQGPNMPGEWPNGIPPHMMGPNPMPPMGPTTGHMPPGSIPPGNVPPGIIMPTENMMMGPEMFNGPNPMFASIPPENFGLMEGMNMQPNIFPPDFNMQQQGIPGPDGPPNFRGGMRGRGAVGHWRGKSGWDGPPRGRGGFARGTRKALCIYFQRKGSCRQGENCTFLHPGVNCPF